MLLNSIHNPVDIMFSSGSNNIASIDTTSLNIPTTIKWSQTINSIKLQIQINHVQVLLSEKSLKLSNRRKSVILPLYNRVYIDQCDIDQMMITNTNSNDTIAIKLEKECLAMWPHLLLQQTDTEIETHLIEENFLVHINRQTSCIDNLYDTLDFEKVINGQGEKTGLE